MLGHYDLQGDCYHVKGNFRDIADIILELYGPLSFSTVVEVSEIGQQETLEDIFKGEEVRGIEIARIDTYHAANVSLMLFEQEPRSSNAVCLVLGVHYMDECYVIPYSDDFNYDDLRDLGIEIIKDDS